MKIALINNNDSGIWFFRRELIEELVRRGHCVYVLTPTGKYIKEIESLGVIHIEIPLTRSISVWKDLKLFLFLYRKLKETQPDVVETMTIKPNVYGVIAAKWAGVPSIAGLVPGAGQAFDTGGGIRGMIIRYIACFLYRMGGKRVDRFWFLNKDDRDLFIQYRIIPSEKSVLIVSEGVNLKQFSPEAVSSDSILKIRNEFDADDDTVVIGCYPGRSRRCKGTVIFLTAAQLAEGWNKNVRFVFIGSPDPIASDNVSDEFIKDTKIFRHFSFRSDIRDIIAATDIITLPSYYREGVPRILLEGLAMKKPIVATNSVGCKETVDEGENGFLVPVQDTTAFTDAVKKLVDDKQLREQFGKASFEKAKREFNVDDINIRVINEVLQLKEKVSR